MQLEQIAIFFHEISSIPTAVLSMDGVDAEYDVRSFQPSIAQFYSAPILHKHTDMIVDVTLSEDQVICGYVIDVKSYRALLLGPVMEYPCTRRTALNILKRMNLSYKRADELLRYFEKIPCMALTVFIRNLFFLNYIINDQSPPEENWYKEMAARLETQHSTPVQTQALVHNPREWDRVLESCIEFGKLEELEDLMGRIRSEGRMGMTANDSIRSFKNVAIASVALVSRAAARGGMEYESALTLSDEYIRRIERCRSFEEVGQVLGQSFFEYTSHVAKIRSLKSESKLVYTVVSYVKKHLPEPIQVSDLADEIGNNVSYLCRTFKQETGKTLKEYINEVKLDEAKYLLLSTDKAIIDIAMELGYSSQAYFATLFKQYTGKTPGEYRDSRI